MKSYISASLLAVTLILVAAFSSCQFRPKPVPYEKVEKLEYTPGSYEKFLYDTKGYPVTMETYRNHDLLKKANSKSTVYVCLEQQRGRLYVDGQVAADWPVSTGIAGRNTPTGHYSVQEKKKEYASNTYGNIYDENGKMVKYNADLAHDPVPEGCVFKGSPMPNWMRLTWDGVGMHTGKVQAGKRLSHGCIRTPGHMASQLYDIVGVGTKVHVGDKIEACYPATATQAVLDAKAEEKREADIKADNAAKLKEWEENNPRAARRYAERQAIAKKKAQASSN